MLMRPAPPQATGPSSPRITTVEPTSHRVHSGLGQLLRTSETRVGTIHQPLVFPLIPRFSTNGSALHSVHSDHSVTPQLGSRSGKRQHADGLLQATFHDNVASPGDQVEEPGVIACGKCHNGHLSFLRSKRGRPHAEPENTRRGNPRLVELAENVEDDYSPGCGGGDNRVPQVPHRVPFHAAFADDPAFHRPDQEVVADDNTKENHRREVLPASDNFSNDDSTGNRYEVRILPEITETSATASDTTGGHRININAISISEESQAEEKEKEEVPAKSETDLSLVQRLHLDDEIAAQGEYGSVNVAQVPQATRPERQQQFRKRQTRRIEEKTGGLLFILYLLALPILCSTNGSPPVNRGSLMHNSSSESGGRHPYRDYSWEVNQINPWLSACDLAGPAPADLQGSCGPPETPKNCPGACRKTDARTSRATDSFSAVVSQAIRDRQGGGVPRPETGGRAAPEQCLFYLEESHKTEICRDDFGKDGSERFQSVQDNRYRFLSGLRLRHCCEHAALNALASGDGGPLEEVLRGNEGCKKAIGKLLAVDALAARLHCEFGEVLARYDCGQPYSVIYNCSHCKEAYRRWVCSSLVPYFDHDDEPRQKNQGLAGPQLGTGMRIRPCRSFCQTVEQRCPYLLPGDRAPAYPTQYAGEPTFLCRDPNIPETGEQASRALHADEECCFHVCSDEDPGLGVCANCTEPQVEIAIRGGNAQRDPSTAPQCELNSASSTSGQHQSTTSGTWPGTSGTTESGNLVHPGLQEGIGGLEISAGTSHQSSSSSGTSFCGTGGVGSMSSGASPRVTPSSITMCAFCAWGALIGMCTIKIATSWTTSESSLFSRRFACTKIIILDDDSRRLRRHHRHSPSPSPLPSPSSPSPSPSLSPFGDSPPAKTIYLVIFGCKLISSFLLVVYEVISELSIASWRELLKIKLIRRYNRDLLILLDDIEVCFSSGNYTRPRRRRRRGCKHRRKKKRRRAS